MLISACSVAMGLVFHFLNTKILFDLSKNKEKKNPNGESEHFTILNSNK
jgi:hypothetical protein